ncbi:caspase protein [Fusarium circinatum]|uniref:Caspase protein n=1 Tax=Fusarium circinatum TaxID=48490 RepID=A0A8H5SNT4_FUSCI|nr:caspase protein [Fusarium circinatum]
MSEEPSQVIKPPKAWIILIGINEYPKDIRDLQGCVRDVEKVEAFFETHFQNISLDVQKLISNSSGKNLPTLQNVKKAIENVKENVGPNDFVYFHYSGHGGRQMRSAKSGVSPGAYIECLVLSDKTTIKDYELGKHFDELATKEANLFVVLDCCHSGGGDRFDSQNVRQINQILPADPEEEIAQNPTPIITEDSDRAAKVVSSPWTRARKYTLLAACHPHQFAKECRDSDNEKNGALTLTMLSSIETLRHNGHFLTYKSLYGDIRAKIGLKSPSQNPTLFGAVDRPIFSLGTVLTTRHATVIEVQTEDNEDAEICIDQGSIHGVHVGEKWKIYPYGQVQMEIPITTVTITKVMEIKAFAIVPKTEKGVERGCILSLETPVYGTPLPVHVQDAELLAKLQELPQFGVNFLSGGSGDFNITPNDQGEHRVIDSTDTPLQGSPLYKPAEPSPQTDTISQFREFLKSLAHCWRLLKLKNLNGDLENDFKFNGGISPVKAGKKISLTFKNERAKTQQKDLEQLQNRESSLYFTLLNIRADHTVVMLTPYGDEGVDSVAVAPGETYETLVKLDFLPTDGNVTQIDDVLMVIVTDQVATFECLATENLFRSGNNVGESFNEQFELMLRQGGSLRAVERVMPPRRTKWQTAHVPITIIRE